MVMSRGWCGEERRWGRIYEVEVMMMKHGQKVARGKDGRGDGNERRYVCILALVTGRSSKL